MKFDKTESIIKKYKVSNQNRYLITAGYCMYLIVFGLLVDSPQNILNGIYKIILQPDTLITDYIGVGGMGAAFVNSGLLTLIFVWMLYHFKIYFSGATMASLFLILGFSFFGKNLFNVWFIVVGVYLYAKVQKDKFLKYIYVALFGTAMAPIVTEMFFYTHFSIYGRIVIGSIVGVSIGFILPPLSAYMMKVHQGFDLYNIGFTAGMIGTIFVSVFKSYGFEPHMQFIWTTGNNKILSVFLFFMFSSMICIGFYFNDKSFKRVKDIMKYEGRLITDFILLEGFAPTLINMGINGLLSTIYILLVGGDLNGPTIGGILTVSGFGAFGKHSKNIIPIWIGVYIGALTKMWSINDASILLAALFGTSLAPIAGEFGWKYGVLAGFIHSSVVLNVGILHGGLNLYNNGFAAGIVAAVLLPVIQAFRQEGMIDHETH
ncbi:DUF1576 domain-containing protein [Anaerophilus nitritogenes]|uniref:DUF1576 domain-containing protein n=1 Tax=Anaerophilus nitritogenes TaxID=2498136 RepID=UPI001930FA71|nr:DUF1576 domain-containing protein [Anaerophilus nitritogenes]